MAFCRTVVLVVLGACASAPRSVETGGAPAVAAEPRSDVDRMLDDATLAQQEKAVLFRRRFAQARALWKAQRLEEALEAVEHALLLQPGEEEARKFRDRLRRDLGYRDGNVRTLASEEAARYEARLDEERLSVRRLIAKAERSRKNGDWEAARRGYERALFILRTSPFGGQDAYRSLREETTRKANGLRDEQKSAEKARIARETAGALSEIERQEREDR